jgi:ABC-type uncharacterized transport system permease subunit
MTWIVIGFTAYLLNFGVGLMAQLGGHRFGSWHHVLYAVVCVSSGLAAALAFHPALVVTLVALAAFPKARPRTILHPSLAVVGLLGYLVTLASLL